MGFREIHTSQAEIMNLELRNHSFLLFLSGCFSHYLRDCGKGVPLKYDDSDVTKDVTAERTKILHSSDESKQTLDQPPPAK